MNLFSAAKSCVSEISQRNIIEICEKNKNVRWFKIKHDKDNRFFVDQCTISSNETNQVYLPIK